MNQEYPWLIREQAYRNCNCQKCREERELDALVDRSGGNINPHWTGFISLDHAIKEGKGQRGVYIVNEGSRATYVGRSYGEGNDLAKRIQSYDLMIHHMRRNRADFTVNLGIMQDASPGQIAMMEQKLIVDNNKRLKEQKIRPLTNILSTQPWNLREPAQIRSTGKRPAGVKPRSRLRPGEKELEQLLYGF